MRGHEGILSRKVVEFQLLQMYAGNKYRPLYVIALVIIRREKKYPWL